MLNLILFTGGFVVVNSVQINFILVPQAVQNNTNQSLIIDCNYSLRPDDSDLILDWYLNEKKVYHWVPPNKPESFGLLKNRLDLSFEANGEEFSKYRALKIKNPTVNLSGDYKCFVSTSIDEDFAVRKLIVFEPEKAFFFSKSYEDSEKINFTCVVVDIYPEPSMLIYINKRDKRLDRILQPTQWGKSEVKNDHFTSILTASIFIENMQAGCIITCELRIPGTNYSKRKTLLYYPLEMRSWNCSSDVHILFDNIFFLIICTVLLELL